MVSPIEIENTYLTHRYFYAKFSTSQWNQSITGRIWNITTEDYTEDYVWDAARSGPCLRQANRFPLSPSSNLSFPLRAFIPGAARMQEACGLRSYMQLLPG